MPLKGSHIQSMPCPVCGARALVVRTKQPNKETTIRVRRCEGPLKHKFETVEFIMVGWNRDKR